MLIFSFVCWEIILVSSFSWGWGWVEEARIIPECKCGVMNTCSLRVSRKRFFLTVDSVLTQKWFNTTYLVPDPCPTLIKMVRPQRTY